MLAPEAAHGFARRWIDAWNAHDLDRILDLYDADAVMHSPLIVERMGEPSGTLRGKEALRAYWSIGLAASPPLRFELLGVYVGVESVTVHYRSVGRRLVAEVLTLDEAGRIVRGTSHHGERDLV